MVYLLHVHQHGVCAAFVQLLCWCCCCICRSLADDLCSVDEAKDVYPKLGETDGSQLLVPVYSPFPFQGATTVPSKPSSTSGRNPSTQSHGLGCTGSGVTQYASSLHTYPAGSTQSAVNLLAPFTFMSCVPHC